MENSKAILAKQALKKNPEATEIIVREGAAAVIRDPRTVNISGTIDAPRKFIEKRKKLHESNGVHVIFSRSRMDIKLNLDEKDHFGGSVTGVLIFNPEYTEFGINKNKLFTIKELQQFLKLRRYFFSDKDENLKIVSNLARFKASSNAQLNQFSDGRGNKTDSLEVTVTTDLSLDFTLSMPIFKGQPANKFKVEIGFDVRDKDVSVWLESAEVRELELALRDSIIDEELKSFTDYVVIEQ